MNLPPDYVEQLRAEYPRRYGDQGWIAVRTLIPRAITAGSTWNEILEGTKAYKRYCDQTGKTGTELVKQAKTFYGPNQLWTEDYSPPEKAKSPAQIAEARRWDGLRNRAVASGFREPMSVESADVYETALRFHERDQKVVSLK